MYIHIYIYIYTYIHTYIHTYTVLSLSLSLCGITERTNTYSILIIRLPLTCRPRTPCDVGRRLAAHSRSGGSLRRAFGSIGFRDSLKGFLKRDL